MLYYISPDQNYIEEVANWLINNFKNLSDVTIILPNGQVCNRLQRILLEQSKEKALILPKILSINNLDPLPDKSSVSYLEQKLILQEIISSTMNINNQKALDTTSSILCVFKEIIEQKKNLEDLSNLDISNSSEYWQRTNGLLQNIFSKWQGKISNSGKLDTFTYHKNQVQALKIEQNLVVAGIKYSHNKAIIDLLKYAGIYHNLILPPFISGFSKNVSHTHAYCNIKQLLDLFEDNKIIQIGRSKKISSQLLEFIDIDTKKSKPKIDIEYIETESIFQEAEVVSYIIKHIMSFDQNAKIGIVTSNIDLMESINLPVTKFAGISLLQTKQVEFIYLIARLAFSEFSKKNLFALLKHPYLILNNVYNLELNSNARRFSDIKQSFPFIAEQIEQLQQTKQSDFTNFLINNIKAAESLYKDIWEGKNSEAISTSLKSILTSSVEKLRNIDSEEYLSLLEKIILEEKINYTCQSNIVAISPKDSIILDFDYVIIADFNENSWPKNISYGPFLNKRMRSAINLSDVAESLGLSLYYFYILLHKKKIYITRSKKTGRAPTVESRFLLKLKSWFENYNISLSHNYDWLGLVNHMPNSIEEENTASANKNDFPSKLYAGSIELLMRNPYGFYAKNILKLRSIDAQEQNKLFGTFVHKSIDLYTKNYGFLGTANKVFSIIELSRKVFEDLFLEDHLLWTKWQNLASSFVEWDESRRKNLSYILTEIEGVWLTNINGEIKEIRAIADRIEIKTHGACIIDYKTGSIPTQKEIGIGLSPQLLIESMILMQGGFKGIKAEVPHSICYVKFLNFPPYIEIREIHITRDILLQHQEGLIQLLSTFVKDNDVLYISKDYKYDDYKYLARNSVDFL